MAMKREVMGQFSGDWEEIPDDDNSPEVMTADVDPSSMTGSTEREGSELPCDMSEWSPEEVAAYNALRSKRKKCCIGGCTHKSLPIARSYHQLPVRNKDIWGKWVEVIRWSRNEPDWTPNGDAAPLLCSRHFPDSDFISYEASSRVRLSHTAIPIYYVDPPEGTEPDPRFANPLPIPPIPAARQKEGSKPKKMKMEHQDGIYDNDDYVRGASPPMKYENYYEQSNSPPQFARDSMGYDIEEVESYDEEPEESLQNFYPQQYVIKTENKESSLRHLRQSVPPSLISFKNPKLANPPALIRANFMPRGEKLAQSGSKVLNLSANMRGFVKKENISTKVANPPTKHKIGIAKCRLIVQTLENQMRIAKTRLAEQLGVPYQVVHGVWNMRDSLKDKL